MLLEFGTWLLIMDASANHSSRIGRKCASEDFGLWFLSHGGYIHPDIELIQDTVTGRSLRVKPDHTIPPDSTVISCPHQLAFSWPNIHEFHFPNVQSPSCSQSVATRLCLIKQRLLGDASPWWPYIKLLPTSFHTPLYYESEDMTWIRGTNLGHARKVRQDVWRAEYDEAMKMLFPLGVDDKDKPLWTWDLYLWAATIMTSRGFPGAGVFNQSEGDFPTHIVNAEGKSPILIPGLDLLNHNPSSRVAWIWDLATCTIKTDDRLSGGSEVPNNYGPKSNEELIMGYGFSLPDNPADHFGIGFSPAVAAYINIAKDRQLDRAQKKWTDRSGNSGQEKVEENAIHWVRLNSGKPEFSPGFLEDLSIATKNPRECKVNTSSRGDLDLSNVPRSRNSLHMICAVLTIIRKGQAGIRKYDRDLPGHPQSKRQIDAARYRQSQLYILDHVLQSLNSELRLLINRDMSWCGRFCIARLDDVLIESPTRLLKDFRGVLSAGLKTRDPRKIRDRGGTDFAFTVWLCGLLVCSPQDLPDSPFHKHCLRWLDCLRAAYLDQESIFLAPEEYSTAVLEADKAAWFDPIRNSALKEDNVAGTAATVASYHDAIRIHVNKHGKSLYNSPEVTIARLTWCYRVVSNEGVWVPNMQDTESNDEWMLCLECPEP